MRVSIPGQLHAAASGGNRFPPVPLPGLEIPRHVRYRDQVGD